MKLKKKSGLMGAVIALSAASLVSVGFASWVISQGDQAVINGAITVDTISNKSHVISNVTALGGSSWKGEPVTTPGAQSYDFDDASNIVFGTPTDIPEYASQNGWLKNNSGAAMKEKLSVSFSFDVSNISVAPTANVLPSYLSIGLEVLDAAHATTFGNLVTKKVIKQLPTVGAGKGIEFSAAKIGETKDYTFTVNVTFAWGDWFSADHASTGSNPYNYYNGLPATSENIADAEEKLGDLAALEGATYKITIITTEDAA